MCHLFSGRDDLLSGFVVRRDLTKCSEFGIPTAWRHERRVNALLLERTDTMRKRETTVGEDSSRDLDSLFKPDPLSPFGFSPFDRAVFGAIFEAEAIVAGRPFGLDESAPASDVRTKRPTSSDLE